MRGRILLLSFVFLFIRFGSLFSQDSHINNFSEKNIIDSLNRRGLILDTSLIKHDVLLTTDQAIIFLQKSCQQSWWKHPKDIFRTAIGQLVYEASHSPYDSVENYLRRFPYDSILIDRERFFIWEPMRFRVRSDSLPVLTGDKVPEIELSSPKQFPIMKDTTVMVISDTLKEVKSSDPAFPFRYYTHPWQGDSIKTAIKVLLDYIEVRDSSIIFFTGTNEKKYPLWVNSMSDRMMRFWLNNELDDSVTVWIGNPERNTIGLYLENGVSFRRPSKQGYISGAKINVESLDKTRLVGIQKIMTKSQFWKFHTEASFALNQALISNWVKGGESSISTALDITWYADYSNKPRLLSSNHFARIKYGLIASGAGGIRKNIDLLETNSKFNHKAFGKFDFSGIILFKTQVSKGYNYPNDSVPVSKFMNPAMLTMGIGLDYKPDKMTSLNFSPISYKLTMVPDTAVIDQTLYGIPVNRRSLHEPGASFLVTNEFKPVRNMTITNRLQLFTSYIHNPLNVDVDWEMILTANLNWFTDVRLNTHLIFDDDTRTPVYSKGKIPVIGSDGLQKKTARIQFKELLGLSFLFRF